MTATIPTPDLGEHTLYTRKEAAAQLRVSLAYLQTLLNEGRIKPVTIGRRKLITRAELVEFIEREQTSD